MYYKKIKTFLWDGRIEETVVNGHTENVRLLLAEGRAGSFYRRSRYDYTEIIRLLLSADNNCAIFLLIPKKHYNVVKLLDFIKIESFQNSV